MVIRAAEVLETVAGRAAESQASYLSFLDHLLEEEVAAREKRPECHTPQSMPRAYVWPS